ncbi:MAG TPA: diguanylate cyclase [Vicinamibacteria bacterium]|nr:diguanylate cyclase [Vicinamibacteria bacterium]
MPIRRRALASVVMAMAVAACDVAGPREGPEATGGLMDLSRWDFEAQGPVALRGEWVFRWGELLGPDALRAGDTPVPPMIAVPRPWNEVLMEGAPLGGEGFATHALRLILPTTNHDLGFAFGEAYSAERLWMNGRLIVERGRVGRTRATEIADVPARIVPIGDAGGVVDLVLETSNHFHFQGGPVHAVRIGARAALERQAQTDARIDFFLIGCLSVIGLFYIALSLSRPDRDIVLFSLLTLFLALRTATTKWHIADLVPIGSEGQLRLDYITFVILPLIFCLFIGELFPADVPRAIPRAAIWYGALALFGPIALDTMTFTSLRNVNIAMGALFATAAVVFVARAALMGRHGASPLLLCSVFVLGTGFHDVAMTLHLIPESRELLPAANTILVVFHAVVLGRRMTDALSASEGLTASLRESNSLLEQRIAERTRDLEKMAMTDPLTGLLNRRPLLKLAEAERARAARSKDMIGVMMIDCDDFKRINDAHGHEAGDQVLRALGQRFSAFVRSHDLLGRWGGEEFVMIFSTADAAGASAAAERLRQHIEAVPFEAAPGVSLRLTVTVGVAVLEDGLESFEDLLRRADRALYAGKTAGRNQVKVAQRDDVELTAVKTRG